MRFDNQGRLVAPQGGVSAPSTADQDLSGAGEGEPEPENETENVEE
jgi:hypothetical protein